MDTKRFEQLWRQVRSNRARTGVLVSVAALGLLLWGRLILLERVPRIATADPEQAETSNGQDTSQDGAGDNDEQLPDPHNRTGVDESSSPLLKP
ncbi:MAG: hypothetical protein AAGC44_05095 [Planctomycetota bacterium]